MQREAENLAEEGMMDYDQENSDHEALTSTESVEESPSEIKNNGSSDNTDPLTEAFNSYHNLQEVLEKGNVLFSFGS